jgi:hypothetical protein
MNKTYRYSGPLSAVTLPDDALPKGRQVRLFPGRDIVLPEDNAYVKALVARGHLTPVAAPVNQAAAAPAVATAPVAPVAAPVASSAQAAPAAKTEVVSVGTASAAAPAANTKPTGA